jgi:hypothetical protein
VLTERVVNANVAVAVELFTTRLAVPSMVVPSKNVTVPSEVPVGVGVTVAVSVTTCPDSEGFGETVRAVLVDPVTVRLCVGDVDVRKPAVPA